MPLSETVAFSRPLKAAILAGSSMSVDSRAETGPDPEVLKAAEAAAYERGLADGRAREAEESGVCREQLRQAVEEVLDGLRDQREALQNELQALLPELLVEGVGRVLHGFEPDGDAMRRIVDELLQGFDGQERRMRLSLNSVDMENLRRVSSDLEARYPELSLLCDDQLRRGECLLDGRFGVVDARHSAKLASLRKVFA